MSESAKNPPRAGTDCERIAEPLYQEYWARSRDGVSSVFDWLTRLQPEVRHLFTAHACWIDAGCGGFGVFYTTSLGALAAESVEGLRALGLLRCSTLVEEANRFFGPSVPREHQTRVRLIETGGIFSAGKVDRSLCRVGFREVARPPNLEYGREWDFSELDVLLLAAFEEEAPDGFLSIADRYARQIQADSGAPDGK